MKRKPEWLATLLAACALAFILPGCNSSSNDGDSTVPDGFVGVPGGTVVGSLPTDVPSEANARYKGVFIEGRTVTLSPFYIAKYPVTKAQYRAIMSDSSLNTAGITADPSYSTRFPDVCVIADGEIDDNRPVECVSWYDAVYYCNLLSQKEGLEQVYIISNIQTDTKNLLPYEGASDDETHTVTSISNADVTMDMTKNGYRLPTEAEREYAARGGNPNAEAWNYLFSGSPNAEGYIYNDDWNPGLDPVGWYWFNICNGGITTKEAPTPGTKGYGTHEVGKKNPNTLGLYDMCGNVNDWCWDLYDSVSTGYEINPTGPTLGEKRTLSGGSWSNPAFGAPVSRRFTNNNGGGIAPYTLYVDTGFRVVRTATARDLAGAVFLY